MSLPIEWIQILSAENPPLSLYELSHTATMADVYDALEFLEFQRYLRIESDRLGNSGESNE